MNKRGFFAVSIIFSFFIVFLLVLTMNLATYAQNRTLLNHVKKDIKDSINLDLPTAKCITTTPVDNLDIGAELICDVNGDGRYCSDEKFMYLSDRFNPATGTTIRDNNDDYTLVLLYSQDYLKCTSTTITNHTLCLPTTDEWKNMRLYSYSKPTTDEEGTIVNSSGFSYTNKAARLATFQEIYAYLEAKVPDGLNLEEFSALNGYPVASYPIASSSGYWLETRDKNDSNSYWIVNGNSIGKATSTLSLKVRPVVEVNLKEVKYKTGGVMSC